MKMSVGKLVLIQIQIIRFPISGLVVCSKTEFYDSDLQLAAMLNLLQFAGIPN